MGSGDAVVCSTCLAVATGWRPVTSEAAQLADLLTGCGIFIAPGVGYLLPACDEHGGRG